MALKFCSLSSRGRHRIEGKQRLWSQTDLGLNPSPIPCFKKRFSCKNDNGIQAICQVCTEMICRNVTSCYEGRRGHSSVRSGCAAETSSMGQTFLVLTIQDEVDT